MTRIHLTTHLHLIVVGYEYRCVSIPPPWVGWHLGSRLVRWWKWWWGEGLSFVFEGISRPYHDGLLPVPRPSFSVVVVEKPLKSRREQHNRAFQNPRNPDREIDGKIDELSRANISATDFCNLTDRRSVKSLMFPLIELVLIIKIMSTRRSARGHGGGGPRSILVPRI